MQLDPSMGLTHRRALLCRLQPICCSAVIWDQDWFHSTDHADTFTRTTTQTHCCRARTMRPFSSRPAALIPTERGTSSFLLQCLLKCPLHTHRTHQLFLSHYCAHTFSWTVMLLEKEKGRRIFITCPAQCLPAQLPVCRTASGSVACVYRNDSAIVPALDSSCV